MSPIIAVSTTYEPETETREQLNERIADLNKALYERYDVTEKLTAQVIQLRLRVKELEKWKLQIIKS